MNPLRPCGIIENGQQLGLVSAHICEEPVNSIIFKFETNEAMLFAKARHCNTACPAFKKCNPEQFYGTHTRINQTGERMIANSDENIPRELAEEIFLPYPTSNE